MIFADGRINRNLYRTHQADGHIEIVPFGAVVDNGGNFVAWCNARFE